MLQLILQVMALSENWGPSKGVLFEVPDKSWTLPGKAQLGLELLEARWLNLHSAIVSWSLLRWRAGRLVLVRVSAIRTGAVIGTWSNLVFISVCKERD